MKTNKLINLALKGDERAYEELYKKYSGKVYALCYSFLKNSADAEDITQEAFLKVSENLEKLKDIDKFESWLLSIAKNCCKEFLRKKKPTVLKNENTTEIFSQIVDKNPTPEQEVINGENAEIMQKILEKLPKEQQEAIVSYYFEEKSIKEIAKNTNCTEHCIRGRIKLGKKRIAKQLNLLEHKDKITYMGACVVFGNLVKPVSAKAAGAGIGMVFGKITATLVATALIGFGGYGLHNLYLLSEKEEQTTSSGNMKPYSTEFSSSDEKNNYLLKVSVPNNWVVYDEEEVINVEYNEVTNVNYFETEYDSQFGLLNSYIRQVGCFVDVGVFDADYDINDASEAFEKHFYEEYYIDEIDQYMHGEEYAFRGDVDFKVVNDTLAVSYNEDKSWIFGLFDNRSTYFAIVDCGVMPNEPKLRYYALLEVDFEDGYHDKKTFLSVANSIKIQNTFWTIIENKDDTCNYIIKDRNGKVLLNRNFSNDSNVNIYFVTDDIVCLSVDDMVFWSANDTSNIQYGRDAYYCDIQNGKTSAKFENLIGQYKNVVLCLHDNDEEGSLTLKVHNMFDYYNIYKEIIIDDFPVNAPIINSCKISQNGVATISYNKGPDRNNMEVAEVKIDLEELIKKQS